MKKLFCNLFIGACLLICMASTTVFAASTTLMTYNGSDIWSKPSVSTFKLTKTTSVTVNHTTSKWTVNYTGSETSKLKMQVKIQKKGSVIYSDTVNAMNVYGVSSKSSSWSMIKGTYRLYFYTTDGKANIKGSVKK